MEGGTIGLVYSARVVDGPPEVPTAVLKVAPPGLPPVRNRDVLRQARVIGALDGQPGVGVPPLLFTDAGDPPDVPPLFASALVAGECQEPLLEASSRERLPEAQSRARAFSAVRMLAALHRVDPAAIGLGDEDVVSPVGEVDRWTRTFDTVPDEVRVGYEDCAEALRATAPEPLPAVVVHGDYRLGNMLSAGDDVLAIIDWEIWSRSDPRIDLSWLLFFTDEAKHPVVPADLDSGMPTDAELLAAYEAETGGPVPDLAWFHALTRYKEAAAMALIAKHLAKKGDTATLAKMADMLPALIADAHARVR
ncbi:MAG: phosphotransferase family protein [Actinobacteria bacterium]|nr:phosphotransferase family protein [Actinomycetota bacterium]